MSVKTRVKTSAVLTDRERWDEMSVRARSAVMDRMRTDVREYVSSVVGSDMSVSEIGDDFRRKFGTEDALNADAEWVKFARDRQAYAVKVTVASLLGDMSTKQGKRGKVSQRALATALGVSQPRISQVVNALKAENDRKVKAQALKDAAARGGITVKGEENSHVRGVIADLAKTDDVSEAVKTLESGKVPSLPVKVASVADVVAAVTALENLTANGLTVDKSDRDDLATAVKTLERLTAWMSTLA